MIAAGLEHFLFLSEDGTVWGMGDNHHSVLGVQEQFQTSDVIRTTQGPLPEIKKVTAGMRHSLFLDIDGNVWACGNNSSGSLGTNSPRNIIKDVFKIENVPKIVDIFAGEKSTGLIDERGSVWVCGDNYCCQLGQDKTASSIKVPSKIENIPPIRIGSMSPTQLVLQDVDDNVWVSGKSGLRPEAIVPSKAALSFPSMSALECGIASYLFMDQEGIGWTIENSAVKEIGTPILTCVSSIAYASIVVDIDCKAWVRGDNSCGQLGIDPKVQSDVNEFTPLTNVPPIAHACAGYDSSLLLDTTGSVWFLGYNPCKESAYEDPSPSKIEGLPKVPLSVNQRAGLHTKSARNI